MNQKQLDDLKQFIRSTVSETEQRLEAKIVDVRDELRREMSELRSELRSELVSVRDELRNELADLRSELHGELVEIRQEMADGFSGVGEAIDLMYRQSDKRKAEVDARLAKLEYQAT